MKTFRLIVTTLILIGFLLITSNIGLLVNNKVNAIPGEPTGEFPRYMNNSNSDRIFLKIAWDDTSNGGNGFIDTPISYAALYFDNDTGTRDKPFKVSIGHGGINRETDKNDAGKPTDVGSNIIRYEFFAKDNCRVEYKYDSMLSKTNWTDFDFTLADKDGLKASCDKIIEPDYPETNRQIIYFRASYKCFLDTGRTNSCNSAARDNIRSKGFQLKSRNEDSRVGLTGTVPPKLQPTDNPDKNCKDLYSGLFDLPPNQCPTSFGFKSQNQNSTLGNDNGTSTLNENYTISFAPPCSAESVPKSITWYDADFSSGGGQGADDVRLSMSLQELNLDGTPSPVKGSTRGFLMETKNDNRGTIELHGDGRMIRGSYNIGGSREYRRAEFRFKKNKQYVWRWNNVFKKNQVQISTPFASINTIQNCYVPSCDQITPSISEINSPTNITVTYTGHPIIANDLFGTISIPSKGIYNKSIKYINRSYTEPNITFTDGGPNMVTWSVNGDINPYTGAQNYCTGLYAGYMPYLKFYGNDVQAGGGFGASCTKTQANIKAYNKGSPNFAGASNQFGAFITKDDSIEFSTAQRPEPNTPETTDDFLSGLTGIGIDPPRSLTFSNTGDNIYGNNSGISRCIPDFYSIITSEAQDLDTITGHTVSDIEKVKIVEGQSVFINGNITLSSSGWVLGQIPSYTLIVKGGNIYIGNNVTQLDGIYIAQPNDDGTEGGEIFTCATGLSKLDVEQLYNTCGGKNPLVSGKLTVNGAFIAKKVWFLRTNGSLRDAEYNENGDDNSIAEVFQFTPEIYLAPPIEGIGTSEPYDSIVGLPPIL